MTAAKWWGAIAAALVLVFALPARSAPRQNFVIYTGAATDTTAAGMADSTLTPMFTAPYQRMLLELKPSRPCRVAIQIRDHGDSLSPTGAISLNDTTKTYVWPWKSFSIAAADSNSLNPDLVLPTSVVPSSNELVVTFAADGTQKWGSGRGRIIPLRGTDGQWYTGENTTIRLRVLSSSGVVTWKATLKCFGY